MNKGQDMMVGQQPMGDVQQEKRGYSWDEAPIEEKLERVRNLAKASMAMLDELKQEVREVLWNHSHEENGEVIIKISSKDKYRLLSQMGLGNAKVENNYI